MSLPAEIMPLFEAFRPAFTEPTYRKVMILLIGTVLAKGKRTVTAALRVLGLEQKGDWSKYHHVLNRTKWDGLVLSSILLHLIVKTFVTMDAILYRDQREHWRRKLRFEIFTPEDIKKRNRNNGCFCYAFTLRTVCFGSNAPAGPIVNHANIAHSDQRRHAYAKYAHLYHP